MGTGGGEHLLQFADLLPADTTATEGWQPNIAVAQRNLAPYGIEVIEYGAPDDDVGSARMPFRDDRFDLVLNRHESYSARELARVTAPGGTVLTAELVDRIPASLIPPW
nr:methyltransferase domain-containing protein [Yimella sp. NH-Cas1]